MTAGGETTDWRDLREFAGVDILRSYILSWGWHRGTLSMDVDLFLTSEHPFYEKPRPREKVCIRPAIIDFPYCDSVIADGRSLDAPLPRSVARLPVGAIQALVRQNDGAYELRGEFGTVRIDAERPIIRLRGR